MWGKGVTVDSMKLVMIGVIIVLLTVVIGISLLAGMLPTVILAILNLSVIPNLSFASFYAAGGAAMIVLGAVVLVFVILLLLNLLGTSKK